MQSPERSPVTWPAFRAERESGLPQDDQRYRSQLADLAQRAGRSQDTRTAATRDAFTALQAGVDHLVKHGLGELVEDLGESRKGEGHNPVDPFVAP